MTKRLWIFLGTMILAASSAQPQEANATSTAVLPATSGEASRQSAPAIARPSAEELPSSKVGLVRGVVKRTDPIKDELVVRAFGGGDVKIAFDPRTCFLPENANLHLTSIPAGAVVSVDTVIDNGKLFARSVRTDKPGANGIELNGKVVRYDAGRSRLVLRDPISPDSVSLRISPSTVVIDQGRSVSPQDLSEGMLVRIWFSPTQNVAKNIEILTKRGDSFVFQGRILSVDLRSNVLALSNNTDQSVRELAVGTLDAISRGLLREGAEVNIQAQFDGDRYNVRSVALVTPNQSSPAVAIP